MYTYVHLANPDRANKMYKKYFPILDFILFAKLVLCSIDTHTCLSQTIEDNLFLRPNMDNWWYKTKYFLAPTVWWVTEWLSNKWLLHKCWMTADDWETDWLTEYACAWVMTDCWLSADFWLAVDLQLTNYWLTDWLINYWLTCNWLTDCWLTAWRFEP